MPVFERITFDPRIMGGRACIRGMRIPVSVVVGQIGVCSGYVYYPVPGINTYPEHTPANP